MNVLDQARGWLDSLAPRERTLVTWGGIGAAVLLLVGALVIPLHAAAARSADRVARKEGDLAWMRSVSGELRAAGPAGAAANGESLLVVVDQSARQAGLGQSLSGSQPSGTGGIRVRLERAPFDTVVSWIGQLQQQHGVFVESATIDRAAEPGVVNASVIFRKPG